MNHGRVGARRAWIPMVVLSSAMLLPGCGTPTDTDTPETPVVALVTDTFSGSIGQNASSVHMFTVTNSGYTIKAGIMSLMPSSVTALGLGVGTWDASTSTCGLNVVQNDNSLSGSTSLSGTTDSGTYCLRVYDGANIPAGETASYGVQVEHY